jgi:Sec7-like guanine-nucleotide exchange factor
LAGSESETVEVGFVSFVKKTDTTAVIQAFNYKTQKEIASTKDLSKVKCLVWCMGI